MSPANRTSSPPLRGVISASTCYLVWGLVPLYWKQMASVDSRELIAHRLVWSLLFLAGLLGWKGGWREPLSALRTWRGLGLNALNGGVLTVNWLIYVWGVNAGHIIECSLGYFLVPLFNVALGRMILGELLRPLQWVAVVAAAIGVALLAWRLGHFPWIALGLAVSFGLYGLFRKRSELGPLSGLAAETLVMAPFATAWLFWAAWTGGGALGHVDTRTTLFILSTGVVTSIPLLLFADGARRLRLTTLGLLQYIAPTCQFLLGWLLYQEPFSRDRAWAFALIWAGLLLYTTDALLAQRRRI